MAKIRAFNSKDLPMAVEMISTSEPWASRHETPEEFRQWLEQSVGQIFIAESDEQPAGLVAFIPGPVLANGGCIQLLARISNLNEI